MDSRPDSVFKAVYTATLRSVAPQSMNARPTPHTESERSDLLTYATRVSRGATTIALVVCLPILLLIWWLLWDLRVFDFGIVGVLLRFLVTTLWLAVFLVGAYLLLVIAVGYSAYVRRLQSAQTIPDIQAQGTTLFGAPSQKPARQPSRAGAPEPNAAHAPSPAGAAPIPTASPLLSSFSDRPREAAVDAARVGPHSTLTADNYPSGTPANRDMATDSDFDFEVWLDTPNGQSFVRFSAMTTTQCQLVAAMDTAWETTVADLSFDWLAAQGESLDSLAAAIETATTDAERDAADARLIELRVRAVRELGFDPVDASNPPQWKPAWVDAYLAGANRYLARCRSDGPLSAGTMPALKVVEPVDVDTISHPALKALVAKSFARGF
ncbi:hypothetical protein L5G28_04580 [Gordonia sp. HY285]|uniref:hypothetical protein n=1 Tax=Gordonia liuliyuniae TaxID=2911517 RepID=UPI001F296139|nr:hypothetical protein [Gordonia liuliyuniae]MCF8609436.1 hypothetical protein [Gordonia liuliyuniae]